MKIFNSFLKYEKENNMYSKEIFGFKYWEYVRFVIYTELKIKTEGLSDLLVIPKRKMKDYLINFKEFKKFINFFYPKKHDVLVISHPRRVLQNGKYENIYIDKLVEHLSKEYSCITFEEPCWKSFVLSDHSHLYPILTENILYTDLFEIKFILKNKAFKIFKRKKYKVVENEVDLLLDKLNKKYNVDIWYIKERVISSIMYGILMRNNYLKIIKRVNPKLVIINYWPTDFKTMTFDICNSLNIPTVELQHGTITYDDPIEHKCYDTNMCKCTAKYFWSFGKAQVDTRLFTTQKSNVKTIGYPFLEEKSKEKLPNNFDSKIKYILIISQTIIGEQMSQFAGELADLLNSEKKYKNYKILFKYHPNEIGRNYSALDKDNIIKLDKKGDEIYKYQRQSFMQIGVYSTAVYEGIAFGLPTVIINNMSGSEEAKKIVSYMTKGIYFADTPQDVIHLLQKKLSLPLKKEINDLWENNSFKRINSEIKKLLKNN